MKRFIILLLPLLLISCATTSKTSYIGIPNDEQMAEYNALLKVRKSDIYLIGGSILKDKKVRLKSDGLVYSNDGNIFVLPYNKTHKIVIKSQINSNFYIGLGLTALTSFFTYSELTSDESSFGGLTFPLLFAAGSGYFLVTGIDNEELNIVIAK